MKAIGAILLIAGIILNVLIFANWNPGGVLNWMGGLSNTVSWCIRGGSVVLGLVLMMAGGNRS